MARHGPPRSLATDIFCWSGTPPMPLTAGHPAVRNEQRALKRFECGWSGSKAAFTTGWAKSPTPNSAAKTDIHDDLSLCSTNVCCYWNDILRWLHITVTSWTHPRGEKRVGVFAYRNVSGVHLVTGHSSPSVGLAKIDTRRLHWRWGTRQQMAAV